MSVCSECGEVRRFTMITVPLRSSGGYVHGGAPSGVTHCRVEPAHDTGGDYLDAIRAKRATMTEAEWAGDDEWRKK